MTIAQNFASKLAVAFVAIAMILMAVPSARAAEQTPEELQKTINDLLAQVAALKAGTSGSSTGSSSSCEMIPAPLTMGATGASVTALQKRLIADGEAIAAGATGYFGAQTKAALASWQTKNAVSPAVGYYGPVTKAAMDAKCTPSTDDSDEDTDNGSSDLSGEASLDDMTIDSADDDTIEEGTEDADVAVATFNFKDGDAKISRLDVSFDPQTADDAWDVLDTVAVYVDGDEVASIDASDKDNYLDEDAGTLRLTGLDIVANEDEDMEVTIVASIQDGLDNFGDVNVSVDNIRYFDADGVATTEDNVGDLGDIVTFTTEAAGSNDEIIVKTNSTDPDATTLELQDDAKSDWYTVFKFDLDTKDSVNDITLNKVPVTVVVSSSTFDGLVDDYELVIDGTTVDTLADNNGATAGKYTNGATTVLTFDVDGDVTIDAGDRVEAELKLRFKSLVAGNEGVTVQGKVTSGNSAAIDAEGTDDVTDLSGAATGDAHTLRTTGIITEVSSVSSAVTALDGNANDYAVYTVKLDVTAFNQDVRISTNPSSFDYDMVNSAGAVISTGTSTPTLTSTADEDPTGYFLVNEGDTETFTFKVTFDPASTNATARLVLNSISFDETGTVSTADNTVQALSPATDYRTDVETIVN